MKSLKIKLKKWILDVSVDWLATFMTLNIEKNAYQNHRLRMVIFPNGASCFQVLKTF